jgi:hypothetical protein
VEEGEALGEGRSRHHEFVHGGDLRPRSAGAEWVQDSVQCGVGEVIEERWRNWRRHDPINLVSRYQENLKSLRGIYIDCGWRDQYHIHYGSRILSQRLGESGIRHRYEEFDDDHSDIDYRMDISLSYLYRALR